MNAFKRELEPSTETKVPQSSFLYRTDVNLRLPDLCEVWDFLSPLSRLGEIVHVQKGFEFKNANVRKEQSELTDPKKKGWRRSYLRADDGYSVWTTPTPKWIPYSPTIRRARDGGAEPGSPQVVLNYRRASRRQWRLKPFIDAEGCPVTSSFLIFRPKANLPLAALWAILLSPVANAYAFSVTSKRDILSKHWREFPVPDWNENDVKSVVLLAEKYRKVAAAARRGSMRLDRTEAAVRHSLLQLDAAVLKAYGLPPELEQRLLSFFEDVERLRVGCRFTSYPKVSGAVNMPFYLRVLMPRVDELTDMRLAGTITSKQQAELNTINASFDAFESTSPSATAFDAWIAESGQKRSKASSRLDEIEALARRRRTEGRR